MASVSHPGSDGPPDLVRQIFLDEMDPFDRYLGLRSPRPGGVEIRAAAEERTGLGPYEQLRLRPRPKPISV